MSRASKASCKASHELAIKKRLEGAMFGGADKTEALSYPIYKHHNKVSPPPQAPARMI